MSSPFEFPAFLFSRLQGFGASTGPVYGICSRALRAQGRSCVPPAAHLLYHGKRNGFHPRGCRETQAASPPFRARCYARMDRFGQAVSVFPLSRSNLRANRAPATASVFFSERSRSEIGTAQPFRPPACASGKRGDWQEGRNRRFLPSCPPAPRRRSFPAFAKAETHALPLRSPIAIYKFPVFLIFTY